MSPGHSHSLAVTCALWYGCTLLSGPVALGQGWRGILPPRGHLAISGDDFCWSQLGGGCY